jgi:hypothetical protein
MNQVKRIAIVSLSVLLACLACGPQARAEKSMQYLWSGAVLKSEGFKVRDHVFFVPPGDWLLVQREDFTGRSSDNPMEQGRPSESIHFAQVAGKKLVASMLFKTGLHPNGIGTWMHQPCAHRDPLHRNTFDSDPTHPECLLVEYTTSAHPDVSAWMTRSIDRWRKDEKLEMPATWLKSTYSKYQSGDYVVITYWINPEFLGGFPPPKDTRWNVNDWHVDNVGKSPERAAFLADWIKWSEAAAASYRNSMASDGRGIPLPPLPKRLLGTLSASPNPCLLSTARTCATTLTWTSTGTASASVFARSGGAAPVYVAGGTSGTNSPDWITAPGHTFELRAGKSASDPLLASIKVNGISGSIAVSPNPCTLTSAGTCSTTLSWTSAGVEKPSVYVRTGNEPLKAMTGGVSGSTLVPWVTAAGNTFEMRAGPSASDTLLASVHVKGIPAPPAGSISASPNPCTLTREGTCTTTLSWTATGVAEASVYVRAGDGPLKPMANGLVGKADVPWVTARGVTFELHAGPSEAGPLLAITTVSGAPASQPAPASPASPASRPPKPGPATPPAQGGAAPLPAKVEPTTPGSLPPPATPPPAKIGPRLGPGPAPASAPA